MAHIEIHGFDMGEIESFMLEELREVFEGAPYVNDLIVVATGNRAITFDEKSRPFFRVAASKDFLEQHASDVATRIRTKYKPHVPIQTLEINIVP